MYVTLKFNCLKKVFFRVYMMFRNSMAIICIRMFLGVILDQKVYMSTYPEINHFVDIYRVIYFDDQYGDLQN